MRSSTGTPRRWTGSGTTERAARSLQQTGPLDKGNPPSHSHRSKGVTRRQWANPVKHVRIHVVRGESSAAPRSSTCTTTATPAVPPTTTAIATTPNAPGTSSHAAGSWHAHRRHPMAADVNTQGRKRSDRQRTPRQVGMGGRTLHDLKPALHRPAMPSAARNRLCAAARVCPSPFGPFVKRYSRSKWQLPNDEPWGAAAWADSLQQN